MRVLVTGSRQMIDQDRIYHALDQAYVAWVENGGIMRGETFTVVHGGAPGADTLANQWVWDRRGDPVPPSVEVHPADWHRYRRMAGMIRNGEMVMAGADLVLAFFQPGAENRGTRDCVQRAKAILGYKGVPIEEMWE